MESKLKVLEEVRVPSSLRVELGLGWGRGARRKRISRSSARVGSVGSCRSPDRRQSATGHAR